MKCNPLRWLWGVLPVALLSWGAAQMTHADIEADLKKRVDEQLSGSGFKWAKTGFSGRDGMVTGTATDEADPARAYDIARSIWGVRVVDNQAAVIDKVDTYQWSVSRVANKVRLAGYVPNEGVRTEIVKQAKANFPGLEVSDEMKLARGAPEAWLSGVTFGIKQVAGLKSGEAKLDGVALTVAGEANDTKTYGAIKTALASDLPKGLKLQDERVTAPVVRPYVWVARHAAGQVLLSGYVPSRSRPELLAAAKAAFPRATIVDKMEAGEGAANGHMIISASALKELARLEEGTAEISDQALVVKGVAADSDIASLAKQGLSRGVPQGFRVTDAISAREAVTKAVSPYTTSIVADASAVVLTGYAPNETAREQMAQLARQRFPGRRIDNRLAIAPGAPEGWQRCYDGALTGVARLGGGRLAMSDRRLDVSGATDDEQLAAAVPNDIKSAVKTDCDANVRVDVLAEAAPDLVWRAAYGGGSDVILEGDVSSAAAKSGLVGSAQRLFPGKNVVDRMRIVETRTRKWPSAAEQGLVSLADLQRGEATLVRQELSVSGQAADLATQARVRERLGRDLVKGYTSRDQITVAAAVIAPPPPPPPSVVAPVVPPPAPVVLAPPPPPRVDPAAVCETSLRAAAREGMIRFERASATLARESFVTLDKLATVAKTCPNVAIEIEGHTDSEGTPERNQRLSDRRAQSIVEYLSRTGVQTQRLTAIGYGETRPLVPNDTAENRAKNRRIEFTVKPR